MISPTHLVKDIKSPIWRRFYGFDQGNILPDVLVFNVIYLPPWHDGNYNICSRIHWTCYTGKTPVINWSECVSVCVCVCLCVSVCVCVCLCVSVCVNEIEIYWEKFDLHTSATLKTWKRLGRDVMSQDEKHRVPVLTVHSSFVMKSTSSYFYPFSLPVKHSTALRAVYCVQSESFFYNFLPRTINPGSRRRVPLIGRTRRRRRDAHSAQLAAVNTDQYTPSITSRFYQTRDTELNGVLTSVSPSL